MRIRKPDDMHLHLRQGEMLSKILPYTISQCSRAIVMPNTMPPVITAADLVNYRETILKALPQGSTFKPLMTFRVMPSTTPSMIKEHKSSGAIAGKLYPDGLTTNSEGGVTDFRALYPTYNAMMEEGLVLCLHGELPGVFSLDRESAFLDTLRMLAGDFPNLRIVLEHATTADAIEVVTELPKNVAATITAHHMRVTLDDLLGDRLNPHLFCKPILKRPSDRDAVLEAATGGNPKFFLGSDSAAHAVETKECACGAAGVYTAPLLLPVLADTFEKVEKLDKLESFTSRFGAEFYQLPLNEEYLELIEEPWTVAGQYNGVVPFLAGQTLKWKVVNACAIETKERKNESAQVPTKS